MFDSMMKEILDQVGGLSSQNTELCSLLRNILQVLFLFCISNSKNINLQVHGMSAEYFPENILLTSHLTNIFDKILLSVSGNDADY